MDENKCEHDYEWKDDSFDHEFGCQSCGYWECVDCGFVDPNNNEPPPVYEFIDK